MDKPFRTKKKCKFNFSITIYSNDHFFYIYFGSKIILEAAISKVTDVKRLRAAPLTVWKPRNRPSSVSQWSKRLGSNATEIHTKSWKSAERARGEQNAVRASPVTTSSFQEKKNRFKKAPFQKMPCEASVRKLKVRFLFDNEFYRALVHEFLLSNLATKLFNVGKNSWTII